MIRSAVNALSNASFDFTAQAADGSVLVAATAFVTLTGSDGGCGAVISTLEILQGGRTLFTLPGTIRGFDPQPEPPTQPGQ